MKQEIKEIKRTVKEIRSLQSSIKEQEIRLNNKLQEPRDFKELVARLFSYPEKEAEKILENMEKECEKLKNLTKELKNQINKARESIEKEYQRLSADSSECLQKLGEKDYKLTDSLKNLGQKTKGFLSKLNPFKNRGQSGSRMARARARKGSLRQSS